MQFAGPDSPWAFAMARRLASAGDGRFAGVAALVRVAYFDSFYHHARLVDGTRILLLHQDGSLLAGQPAPPGGSLNQTPTLREAQMQQATRGNGPNLVNPFRHVDHLAALAPVTGYPLAVVVTRDRRAVLAPWLEQSAGTVMRTLAPAALAVALMLLLRRQMAHLHATRASLQVSRERFALAAAGADVGIWDWDIAGNRIFASPRTLTIYGFDGVATGADADEWFGELRGPLRTCADAALLPGSRDQWFTAIRVHPDDVAQRDEALRAHLAGESPAYFHEFRVCGDDGVWRWVAVRGLCVRDASGKAVRIAGSVADIDARKRAEDALRKSEQRFALAVAGSDDGVWDFDYAADEAFASPHAREIMGLPPQPEVQRPLRAWIEGLPMHPDDDRAQHDAVRAHLDGRTPAFEGEWRFRRPDGGWRWVRVRGMCVRDASGQPLRMAGSVSDIDARKRAEQALRESQERYELAVAGSDDGVWDWDYGTGLAFESARARQIQGLPTTPEQQPLPELQAALQVHPEDAPLRAQAMQAHLAGLSAAYECEYRVRHTDGRYRWVRVRALCVRDLAGEPLRIAGSVSDIDAHKRAQEALRNSEERFALAVAGSSDGILDWNVREDTMYVSARALRIAGIDAESAVRSRTEWTELLRPRLHPEDLIYRNEALRAHLAGETPTYSSEFRVCGSDGAWRWVRVRGVCVRDAVGQPLRMAGSVSDIDSRKRAEDALRKSEERFALAVAGSNDGILDWNVAADSMYVSARALRIAGIDADEAQRTRSEWIGMLMPLLHPDDARRLQAELSDLVDAQHQTHDGEYRVRNDVHGWRWIRFRGMSIRDASGRALRWTGSVSDIDAGKQVQEALRRSEERYELAVAGSNEGLWDWDLASDRLYMSPRAQALLWSEPTAPQQTRRYWIDHTNYHPDDVVLVRAAISAHLRGETPHFMVEYRLQHHTGAWHWYRQRGVAVRDTTGRPTRMAGSMEDITDRKNAEQQRERLELQLRQAQKLEAMGTLAGGIAHDFNNILAAILGYGELAQKDARPGTPLRRHIDAAVSAGMRAKSLVERILAFSRSGVGERKAVHVQSVIEEALNAVATSLPTQIGLQRQLDAGDAAVVGDATQLHQVVMNLCANAVHAMRGGGTLTVTLDRLEYEQPDCATCQLSSGNYLRLRVRDTGSGISDDVRERIFDPFFTTRDIGVGTGLGLSLVHGIVTDLGGGIDVQSRVGEGATFTVFLPRFDGPAKAEPIEEIAPVGQGETVLLIDDEETLVRLGEEMLARLGYEPVGFSSGYAALEAFRAEPQRFDAVLSDEAMPQITGSELARAMHAIRPDLPFVLMSGYVSPGLSARAQAAGVIEVLAKPLASNQIARCLAASLQRKGSALQSQSGASVHDIRL
ncbi:MAG: PAS domain-containing protein [Burkholderiaceae bacterium]